MPQKILKLMVFCQENQRKSSTRVPRFCQRLDKATNVSEQTNSTFSDAILLNNSAVVSNESIDGGLPAVLYWEKECHRNLLAQHSAVISYILFKAWNEIDKKGIDDHAEINNPL